MEANEINNGMTYKIFNIFPVGGGGAAAATPLYVETMTWGGIGDLAIQTAILAVIGGVIGYGIKYSLDRVFKKK